MTEQIKELDKHVVRELAVELAEVMGKTLKKYGLDVSYKRGLVDPSFVDLTFEIVVPEAHEDHLNSIGDMYGAEFKIGDEYSDHTGTTFRVTGFNANARKNRAQIIRLSDGGHYRTTIQHINSRMRFEKAKAQGKVSGNEWNRGE